MNGRILKLLAIGIVLTGSVTLGACGGGDNTAASPAAPVAAVTMVREVRNNAFDGLIPILDDAAATVIVAVINAGIPVRAIRCGSLSPPRNVFTVQVQTPVLLLDVSIDDVEKLKAFKFTVFGPADQARKLFLEACQ
jgi:hypothetical protein